MKQFIRAAMLIICLLAAGERAGAEGEPLVFAAASLREVLEEAASAYAKENGEVVKLVFAASSVLARQIDAGAPASIYISADEAWMDWIVAQGRVKPETVRMVAGNSLIVVSRQKAESIDPGDLLVSGRFAMGDPSHVPAGRYAMDALLNLDLWERVSGNAVYCENVRVALEFARRGEVDAAIVYRSDLMAAPELNIVYEFPGETHQPIRYAAAVVENGDRGGVGFLEFLSSPAGRGIFSRYGFNTDQG